MTPLSIAVGSCLRGARLAAGLTCAEVAAALGSHRPVVGRVERGLHGHDVLLLARHAAAVGVTLADIGRVVDDVLAAFGAAAFAPAQRSRVRRPSLGRGPGPRRSKPEAGASERHVCALARQRMHHAAAPVLDAWASARRAA